MISNKELKQYEFSTIEDYYNYIIESEINGNHSQCRELVNKLSKEQYLELAEWINAVYQECHHKTKYLMLIIKWRNK